VAGEELARIRERNGGVLTPTEVVNASRPEDAPLHECFTWDNREAAKKYREGEARAVISSVTVEYENESEGPTEPIRCYVHVPQDDGGQNYTATADVMTDADMRQRVVEEALAMLEGWRRRYANLEELGHIFAAMDETRERTRTRQQRSAARTTTAGRRRA
jgi:hypothetical protein